MTKSRTCVKQNNIDVSHATTIHNKNKLYSCLFSPLALPFHFHVLHDLCVRLRSSLALFSLGEVYSTCLN